MLVVTKTAKVSVSGVGLGLEEKVLQFFKTFVVILDGSEQGTPWHFARDNKKQLAIV